MREYEFNFPIEGSISVKIHAENYEAAQNEFMRIINKSIFTVEYSFVVERRITNEHFHETFTSSYCDLGSAIIEFALHLSKKFGGYSFNYKLKINSVKKYGYEINDQVIINRFEACNA